MEPAPEQETQGEKAQVDEWALKELKSSGKQWGEKTSPERAVTVFMVGSKIILVILMLYMFIISLGLMGSAFKVWGGKNSGKTFQESEIFSNPVASLSLGILATVLVQSSSTSTSVIITMTAAGLITFKNSIPMIMGANIGTAVTASIVSLGQVGNRDEYRRAFAGAIVHYCFNVLTVVVLLPLEVATGMLRHISVGIVDAYGITNEDEKQDTKQDFLKKITKPVSKRLLQVDKKLITKIAQESDPDKLKKLEETSIIVQAQSKDNHLFMDTPMSDDLAGLLLVIVSLMFLSVCLVLLVTTLQSVFRGRVAIWMGKFLNLEFKKVPLIGDYILMLFGVGLTILMQSSSVTTSTLTPLVGIGLIRVEKMFPFTIGANIGTTVTGCLAALASSNMKVGMQVAMSHLLFNLFGTLMWFMVPAMRAVPLAMAKFLGSLANEVRAFPVFLIIFAWVLCPVTLFLLSVAGVGWCAVVGGLCFAICVAAVVIIALRAFVPNRLPEKLRGNPGWLPPTLCLADERTIRYENWFSKEEAVMVSGDADMGSSSAWWQSPWAWANGWFVVMVLIVAVPNCQWGNLKYPKFDGRDHVGIGAWQACSAMYTEDQTWAKPRLVDCSPADLQACGSIKDCASEQDGANVKYEKSWVACRKKCSPQAWETFCLGMACGGAADMHKEQCTNVTQAVNQKFQVTYRDTKDLAWAKGDRCRDISEMCDNSSTLGRAGIFGWLGFAFAFLGQVLLLVYVFMGTKRPGLFKFMWGSLAAFFIAWVFMLVSWATFAGAVNGEATCTVMDASATGAVVASGNFGDIIHASGSYSYAFVIGSWLLTTIIIGVLAERIYRLSRQKATPEEPKTSEI